MNADADEEEFHPSPTAPGTRTARARSRCSGRSPVYLRSCVLISREQFQFDRMKRRKAAPVNGTRTLGGDGGQMLRRAIAFVPGKTVSRMEPIIFNHHS